MAVIPESHKKYNVLHSCKNSECFSYPSLSELEELGESNLDPYGFSSVEEYNTMIDRRIAICDSDEKIKLFRKLQADMIRMNNKCNWSICRFIGEDMPPNDIFGLKKNRCYYWPCDIENPRYEGVIDEEEYTSYWYPTEPDLWEILEDPTGMAYRTIYEKKDYASKEAYEHVMKQLKELEGK